MSTTAISAQGATSQAGAGGPTFRTRREERFAVMRGRRERLIQHAPHAPAALINALASGDAFWGADERWKSAIAEAGQADTSPTPTTADRAEPPASPSPGDPTTAVTSDEEIPSDEHHLSAAAPANQHGRGLPWRRRRHAAGSATTTQTTSEPAADLFDVPAPGGRSLRIGRGRSWATRIAITASPLILVGGLAYSCGVTTGSSRVIVPPVITTEVAQRYGLSTFPVDQAAAFGVSYLTLCLTHPDLKDEATRTNRAASLASMTSAGVTKGCGWDGKGAAQQPVSVTYAGTHTPVDAQYPTGAAEQLAFVAVMQDGRSLGVGLPVWASGEPQNSQLRVVGDVAILPAVIPTAAPAPNPPRVTDAALSRYLTSAVLQPYFLAWGASDQVQLALLTTTDSTSLARQGMGRQISDPHVDPPTVVITQGDPTAYVDGNTATARTTVTWATPNGEQRTTYEVFLRLLANRWLVVDIAGGPVDPGGGGTTPSITFATPTAAPSTS